jgi:hypothetical protein
MARCDDTVLIDCALGSGLTGKPDCPTHMHCRTYPSSHVLPQWAQSGCTLVVRLSLICLPRTVPPLPRRQFNLVIVPPRVGPGRVLPYYIGYVKRQ